MKKEIVSIKLSRNPSAYDAWIGSGLLDQTGRWARESLRRKAKLLVVSNRKVFGLYGKQACSRFTDAGFTVDTHLIGDGERFKNLRSVQGILDGLMSRRFTRGDAVVALGGGIVGDVAGFAAAVYLRGIAFLQVPTTLVAMIDSSVGGKTGVNTTFGKNLIGSFHQPQGVLIDPLVLRTLERREMTAGLCEAIKQSVLAGPDLFRQTEGLLGTNANEASTFQQNPDFLDRLTPFIAAQLRFKAKVVQNDEIESPSKSSPSSRKILNFGHTLGHALEKATNYSYLKHGEAVGHGMIFAAELSKRLELIGQTEVDLLNDVVRRAGPIPAISHIDPSKVTEAFTHDKKNVGESLQWILLRGIGKPVIFPSTKIPPSTLRSTLESVMKR